MKNKNCYLCGTDDKIKTYKLCNDCIKIKRFIRSKGLDIMLEFILDKQKEKVIVASAPPY